MNAIPAIFYKGPHFNICSNAAKFACVKCKAEISMEECFQDRAATMELKKATLQCISPGCSWQGSSEEYLVS